MKPIALAAQQHVTNANTQIARAIAAMQRTHGQATPRLLAQVAILRGQAATLAKLAAP